MSSVPKALCKIVVERRFAPSPLVQRLLAVVGTSQIDRREHPCKIPICSGRGRASPRSPRDRHPWNDRAVPVSPAIVEQVAARKSERLHTTRQKDI